MGDEGKINLVFDNAALKITPEFTQVENERLEQVKKAFTDFDKFNLCLINEEVDCSLKFFAQVFLNYDQKWPHLENLSF